ncbi:MAG: hypothetical protein AMXMBFR61_15670 [Fimbriimonadales bacterium]
MAALLVGVLLGFTASRCGLFDLDEGFYASAAAEMVRSGDYLTPRYAQKPFLEKPPLLYWCMAGFLRLGVSGALAVRLPSVMAATLLLLLVGWAAARRGAGVLAVTGLAVTPIFFGLGSLAYTDVLLTLFLTAALLLFWSSLTGGPAWLRGPMAICLGLGTLTKGPIALVLFLLIAGIAYWKIPSVRHAYRKWWVEAAILYVLVAVPWYYLIYKVQGPEFFSEFILRQNLGRFGGGDTAHAAPIYFYLPVLLVGMFPWSLYLPWLAVRSHGDPFHRYCWTWFWVVFVFFSLSGSKLPSYILPAFPAIALMLPIVPFEMTASPSPSRAWGTPLIATGVVALAGAVALMLTAGSLSAGIGDALRLTALALAAMLIVATLLMRLVRVEVAHCVTPVLIGAGLVLPLALVGMPAYYDETHRDVHVLADRVRPLIEKGATYVLYRVRPGHPSVMFYMPKQGVSVGNVHAAKPYTGHGEVYITLREHVAELRRLGLTEIDSQGKFVAMRSAPAENEEP